MEMEQLTSVLVETAEWYSEALDRNVRIDFYLPADYESKTDLSLLLINDGQDLVTMGFEKILEKLVSHNEISPLLCVGIHCGPDRKNEYGMLVSPDYKGRGAKAPQYQQFIFQELLPYIYDHYAIKAFKERAFAGFSLGGLNALDLTWNFSEVFSKVGVFSGSLWWRSRDTSEKEYNHRTDRMMHYQISQGTYKPGLQFFFQCGASDEIEDRNHNGVIDSIDDTIDLMRELLRKGYKEGKDMTYLQLEDGRHDVPTWAKAFPTFLKWGWRKKK
jgi:enterochelin esterase-like enzyme